MKSLKDFILETYEDGLDETICKNIKSELEASGIKIFYVETEADEEEEYPMVYVATCDFASYNRWKEVFDSTEFVNIIENIGVEFVREKTSNIKYLGRKAFEIVFGDSEILFGDPQFD